MLLGAAPAPEVVEFGSSAGVGVSAPFLAEKAVKLFPVSLIGVLCVRIRRADVALFWERQMS